MPAHRIAHYNLRLNRPLLQTVADFYIHIVGLEIGPRPPLKSYGLWMYADGQDLLHLSEELDNDQRQIGSHLTFDHVAIACTNWPEFEKRLIDNQVEYRQGQVPGTDIRQVFFRDPAGNGVELIFKSREE